MLFISLPYSEYSLGLYPELVFDSKWLQIAFNSINSFLPMLSGGKHYSTSELDNAAAAGYALAQAEMELGIMPLALEGLKAKASRKPAHDARRKAGEPVRAEARKFILENPNTAQGTCARHVSQLLARNERTVNRMITDMFEDRITKTGVKEKRPKPEYLPKVKPPG